MTTVAPYARPETPRSQNRIPWQHTAIRRLGALAAGAALAVVGSGQAAARRDRRSTTERLAIALDLLRDPSFDALLTGSSPLTELPRVMARLADGRMDAICHSDTYDGPE